MLATTSILGFCILCLIWMGDVVSSTNHAEAFRGVWRKLRQQPPETQPTKRSIFFPWNLKQKQPSSPTTPQKQYQRQQTPLPNDESTSTSPTQKSLNRKPSFPPSLSNFFSLEEFLPSAPPFLISTTERGGEGDGMGMATSPDISNLLPPEPSPHVTHFCFLVHGHRGLSKDLSYMQWVMQQMASQQRETLQKDNKTDIVQDMVVYNSICNEYKTKDGIQNGGDRLVEEMKQVIRKEMSSRTAPTSTQKTTNTQDITISVVGNSLGGMYGRYAIAKLVQEDCIPCEDQNSSCYILDNKFRLHLNIFCTTATPHLGVSKHTYVKIPRSAEIAVAHGMGDTGRDLFRLNSLLKTMATCNYYLLPLSQFRKRIAYANAYGTDFPVPAGTAAFLSESSTYPHHFVSNGGGKDKNGDNGLIVATLHTLSPGAQPASSVSSDEEEEEDDDITMEQDGEQQQDVTVPDSTETNIESKSKSKLPIKSSELVTEVAEEKEQQQLSQEQREQQRLHNELDEMSQALDRLGWKKVFVDVRQQVPSLELPSSLSMRSLSSPSSNPVPVTKSITADPLVSLGQEQQVVSSRDIHNAVLGPNKSRKFAIPIGHNMIVAFSRSPVSTSIYKGGRPVVDSLTQELVEFIFSWNETK